MVGAFEIGGAMQAKTHVGKRSRVTAGKRKPSPGQILAAKIGD
jgi:hypothetical protein